MDSELIVGAQKGARSVVANDDFDLWNSRQHRWNIGGAARRVQPT